MHGATALLVNVLKCADLLCLDKEIHSEASSCRHHKQQEHHERIRGQEVSVLCGIESTEGRTASSLTFPADVWDGGPFGGRRCQPRQTAALGSAPDLTESSPSISHII